MKRFLNAILIVLALLLMGARDLPRPCLGDGLGNPCAIEQCRCTALCSCRSVCDTDASTANAADASCHLHAADDADAGPTHFSLPEPQPPTLLFAGMPRLNFPPAARELPLTTSDPYPPPSLLPAEPPPRIRA